MASHLLQVLPSVVRVVDGDLQIDADFCESLRLYCENFDQVAIACPIRSDIGDIGLQRCRPLATLPFADRIRIVPLPNGYALRDFVSSANGVIKCLREEINAADYLLFSPHSVVGDWPTLAVREAIRQGKRYAIDADVVYHEVARVEGRNRNLIRRVVRERIIAPFGHFSYRYALQNSSVALLQGQDVFDAFAPFCTNPQKVYHAPISQEDCITESQLSAKLLSQAEGRPLRLCYVGRCIDMKGPTDWLKMLKQLNSRGVDVTAVWLGDGVLLEKMRAAVRELGLESRIEFRGYVANRDEVLRELRASDMFVFCHQTPESPRCLLEALASGCPLVGYGSAYPRELVAEKGGGAFVDVGDWQGLARQIEQLASDRSKVRDLIIASSSSGRLFDRDTAMQRRIDLIKMFAGPANVRAAS